MFVTGVGEVCLLQVLVKHVLLQLLMKYVCGEACLLQVLMKYVCYRC